MSVLFRFANRLSDIFAIGENRRDPDQVHHDLDYYDTELEDYLSNLSTATPPVGGSVSFPIDYIAPLISSAYGRVKVTGDTNWRLILTADGQWSWVDPATGSIKGFLSNISPTTYNLHANTGVTMLVDSDGDTTVNAVGNVVVSTSAGNLTLTGVKTTINGRVHIFVNNFAPTDGTIGAAYTQPWIDETLHRMYFRTKYSDNVTFKTGVLPLSGGASQTYFDHFANVGNGTTVETDLYSDTLAAGLLANNGEKIVAQYAGAFVSSGTATRDVKVYFGGTAIFDTGAILISSAASWDVKATFIRVSATVVRYSVVLATQNAPLADYVTVGELTGLTLANTQVVKITGQAAGAGAASNDIVAKLGTLSWIPAA